MVIYADHAREHSQGAQEEVCVRVWVSQESFELHTQDHDLLIQKLGILSVIEDSRCSGVKTLE